MEVLIFWNSKGLIFSEDLIFWIFLKIYLLTKNCIYFFFFSLQYNL